MTFSVFLKTHPTWGNDWAARDFASDALEDPDLPEVTDWETLSDYMRMRNVCDCAMVGARSAFNRWKENGDDDS